MHAHIDARSPLGPRAGPELLGGGVDDDGRNACRVPVSKRPADEQTARLKT
jgi:hypothetical protein